jgi:hypothetical protein
MLFVVKDGRKFRYIAVLEIRPWIKRQRLNERTACLNGKFLKDFLFLVQSLCLHFANFGNIELYSTTIYRSLRSNNQALQEHKIK